MHDLLFQDGAFQIGPAAAIAIAALMIGYSTGGWPGGASLAAPVLTLAIPFERAQPAVLPLLVFSQLFALVIHRKNIVLRELGFVVALATVGIGIGWCIWSVCLDLPTFPAIRTGLKFVTALLTIGLAINLYLTRVRQPAKSTPEFGTLASALWCIAAGALSTIANVAGPLVVWFLNARHLNKEQLTATVAVSFLLINTIKFVPYSLLGFYDVRNFPAFIHDVWVTLPVFAFIVVAIFVGKWRLNKSSQRRFNIALVAGMIVVASAIIWQVAQTV